MKIFFICINHFVNIQVLRDALDRAGLPNVGIIAADGNWDISSAMLVDSYLNDAVDIIGYGRDQVMHNVLLYNLLLLFRK